MGEESTKRTDNLFTKRIYDRETGNRLVCRLHPDEHPAKTFHVNWWLKGGIPYDEVMRQTVAALRREHSLAQHVLALFDTEEGVREKRSRKEIYSAKARKLFAEMAEIEAPDLKNYQQMRDGRMTEEVYLAHRQRIDKELAKKEILFSDIMEKVDHLEQVFSPRNAWVKFYSRIEVPDVLDKEQITKWVGHLVVDDMTTVELYVPEKYAAWRAELPQKWLETL